MDCNDGALGGEERLESLARALGCRVRLEILRMLAARQATVNELVRAVGATQPNVSNHLTVLRAAELVTGERHGREVRYRIVSTEVIALVRAITALACVRPPAGARRLLRVTESRALDTSRREATPPTSSLLDTQGSGASPHSVKP